MKTKTNSSALFIATLAYIAYSCVYICRLNISVAAVYICQDGYMNETQIGILSGLFLASYAAGKLLLGRVGDRIQPKILIISGLFLCSLTNLLFGFFPPIPVLYLLWLLNGLAQSLIWGPILRIVSSHFAPEKRTVVLSFLATCVGVGSILGVGIATAGISLTKNVSSAFFIPSALTFTVTLIFLFFVHDKSEKNTGGTALSSKELLCDKAFRRMSLPAFLHGIIKDNINTWMCLFFASVYNLDLENLAFYIFLVPLLTLAGRVLFIPCLKLFRNNENHVASFSLATTAILMAALSTGVLPMWAALATFSLSACAVSMANTTMLTVYPTRYLERGGVSLSASYMDVLTYSGASAGSLVFGAVVNSFGYSPMFISWTAIALVSSIALLYKSKQ